MLSTYVYTGGTDVSYPGFSFLFSVKKKNCITLRITLSLRHVCKWIKLARKGLSNIGWK